MHQCIHSYIYASCMHTYMMHTYSAYMYASCMHMHTCIHMHMHHAILCMHAYAYAYASCNFICISAYMYASCMHMHHAILNASCMHQCIHVNPNRPVQHTTTHTPPRFSPLGVHTLVLYICVSTSALQTGSSVPFLYIPHTCVNIRYLFFSF